MLIQIILIVAIAVMIIRLIVNLRSSKINVGYFALWLIIWLVAILFIWFPGISSYLADTVGVGRGVDLIVYVAIIAGFYLQFKLLMRIEKMEKDITKITRQLAIKDIDSADKK